MKNKFRKQKCQYAISGEIAGSTVRGATGETINNNFDLTLRNRRPTRRVKVVVDGASHNLSGIKRKTYKTKRTEKDARLYARPRILFLQEMVVADFLAAMSIGRLLSLMHMPADPGRM